MDTNTPKTIFITGATGLVGGHAAEEALQPRPPRPGPGPGHQRHPLARPVGRREGRRRPGRRRGAAAGRRRGRLGLQLRGQGRRLGHARGVPPAQRRGPPPACSTPPRDARVERFVHVSSLGVYEGRDHHGTDETVPPAANSLDAYTRSKTEAEALVLEYHRGARAARRDRPPRLHLRRARPDRPAQAADEPAPRDLRLLRLRRAGAQLHLRQEPGPRHLPRRREPRRRRRGLQPDRRRARDQAAVRRPGRRAGRPAGPRRGTSRWGWRKFLANVVEGIARLRGAKNPPLINKARYKFLGLNLDYSIDKARSVLGYQPPYTLRRGDRAGHGRAPPRGRCQPATSRRPAPTWRIPVRSTSRLNLEPRGAT